MTRTALEMWAGFECTLNRVGDVQHDQFERAGHYGRLADIDQLAALGVRTVRYPVLWERIEGRAGPAAWQWADASLGRLRAHGIDPIVGLLHHGSGPLDTSLLDDDFPLRFARFAASVAARYPWVTRFTPINEPLTTARFSALYGVWYPHRRDDGAFMRALLNQSRATVLAMAAIRRVTPGAQLVQTEDLGRTHATPALAAQASFENERRWLSFDLLAGRVRPGHPLWSYVRSTGATEDDVARAVGDGCAPDLMGINHYVTSERWLDERLERYPPHAHGGNGRQRYADVEAVRAMPDGVAGPAALLGEAWARYGIPLAVTEAHLGCTREQQLRWLHEIWMAAHSARDAGADVRAVTAWAALGTHDWCSLVTECRDAYEPGLFDTRSPAPRATALAAMTRGLATQGAWHHPVLEGGGWWRESSRLVYEASPPAGGRAGTRRTTAPRRPRPLLVTGARGTLGRAVARMCEMRGLHCVALDRQAVDITVPGALDRAIERHDPWAVINAAGYVRVDDAEWSVDACRRANVDGAESLARACAAHGIRLATFSSDLVFDGARGRPYVESDAVAPLGVYGQSKADAEICVMAAAPDALVVRTAWFFGPLDPWSFLTTALQRIACGEPVELPDDLVISPTWVPHLVDATLDLLIDGEGGIWHLANEGSGTVACIVRRAARDAGLDPALVEGRPHEELGWIARRPRAAALASERGRIMPTLDRALAAYRDARPWRAAAGAESTLDGRDDAALAF